MMYTGCGSPDKNRTHNTRDIIGFKMIFYQEKLTTRMLSYMIQFDYWDIYYIEVGGKEANDCGVIGTPKI